ncbi:hypothetical protein NHQ30_010833 [Ciborinia camelliae]|nr:hypothetical protein NHQ30_010833 [Ciborinia camelliae]
MVAITKLIALLPFVVGALGAPTALNAVQHDILPGSYKDLSKRVPVKDEDLIEQYKRSADEDLIEQYKRSADEDLIEQYKRSADEDLIEQYKRSADEDLI